MVENPLTRHYLSGIKEKFVQDWLKLIRKLKYAATYELHNPYSMKVLDIFTMGLAWMIIDMPIPA